MPRPYHLDHTRAPRETLRLREAAFVLQQSVPSLERQPGLLVHPDGRPGIRFRGSIRMVDVECVEALLRDRGEVRASAHGGLSRLDALDLLVHERASVPPFPRRNGSPPPLSAIQLTPTGRDQS